MDEVHPSSASCFLLLKKMVVLIMNVGVDLRRGSVWLWMLMRRMGRRSVVCSTVSDNRWYVDWST